MTFEDVLADLRERITMLRVEGHPVQAASVERAVEQLVAALPEYLALLSEAEAVTYSGRSLAYLRARFGAWHSRGLAEWHGRVRYYRRCVLEHRGNADIAREAGRRAVAA
jgi:hypothetical protein